MVVRLFFSLMLIPTFLFSGIFTASVNSKQIHLDQSFELNLTLQDATATANPNTDILKSSFLINSQQQSSSTIIINNQVTSSASWQVLLLPLNEGEVLIPSISIETTEGTLSTKPISINVVKGPATSDAANDIQVSVDVTNKKPYKNEPIIYTVRLQTKKPLMNLGMQKPTFDDAIVEANGDPKIYQTINDGVRIDVVEFSFLITPLKPGPLKIPSSMIQGEMPVKSKTRSNSFFDMSSFSRLKPFALKIEEVLLEVLKPVASVLPWLPAKSFQIEETFNESTPLQVGEPITRSITMRAEGITAVQLPSLNDQLSKIPNFKVYADKPEMQDAIDDGIIKAMRKEEYTVIPQTSGTHILPEISVAWWDLTKNEKAITRIAARKVQILPASTTQKVDETPREVIKTPSASTSSKSFYLIIILALLLLACAAWLIILQKKIRLLTKATLSVSHEYQKYAPPIEKKKKLPNLNPT